VIRHASEFYSRQNNLSPGTIVYFRTGAVFNGAVFILDLQINVA